MSRSWRKYWNLDGLVSLWLPAVLSSRHLLVKLGIVVHEVVVAVPDSIPVTRGHFHYIRSKEEVHVEDVLNVRGKVRVSHVDHCNELSQLRVVIGFVCLWLVAG